MSSNGSSLTNPAIERLIAAETAAELWTLPVLGFRVYPLLRLDHYRRTLLALSGTALERPTFKQHAPAMSARVRTSAREAAAALSHRLQGKDVWVFSSSNYRRKDETGAYENIFTGHIREQFGSRVVFLEKNLVNLPAQDRDDLVFVDALHWAALSAGKLAARGLQYLVPQTVARAFEPTSRRRLAALAVYGQVMERAYQKLVESFRPKVVFVLNSYSEFVPAQRVVKRAGIPLVEVQHGIIHHSHPGYAYPPHLALEHAPDHILTFGARFGAILEETAEYWRGRWSVGGHGWLQKRARHASSPVVPRVVLFSQPEPDVQKQVNALAAEVRQLVSSEVEVVVKPHPNERNTSQVYAAALGVGVRLAGVLDDSYALLASCSVAVSIYSTVALEALAFPCLSAVVESPRWSEEIRAFVEMGELRAVSTASDIVRLLGEQREGKTDVARELFGVGVPAPDFGALLAGIAEKKRAAGG